MASGGFPPNKQGKPDPKRKSNWQRSVSSDRDDAQSLNSLASDVRINNWDLSDLRPTNLGVDSKRRKKSKGNPEREREQSLSVDSPPYDQKQHSPSSYPRTASSERVALEFLKQHLTFSDMDDQVSTDGERNNERQASQSHRRRLQNSSLNHAGLESDRRVNRNNNMDTTNKDQEPDSNEVLARLMQIRDFMKQARSMLDSMERLGDRKKPEDIEKVRRLIRNLQEQEQGYRGLLHNTMDHLDDDNERSGARAATGPDIRIDKDDSDDETSVDLEVKTENSETSENSQESRPRIESKLGIESEDEREKRQGKRVALKVSAAAATSPSATVNANTSENATMSRSPDGGNIFVADRSRAQVVPVQESAEGARANAEVDSPSLQHQELLKILKEKQQQLSDLMGRQEELDVKRRETEKKLLHAQARDNKARAALSAASHGRQFVEQKLASHQTQSLLEAVTATSAVQAAAAASAASLARNGPAAWDRQDLQFPRRVANANNDDDDNDENGDETRNKYNDDGEDDDDDDDEMGAIGESKVLKSNIVGYPESDDEDNSNVRELGAVAMSFPNSLPSSLPNELLELKRQLNFLRNEFTQVSEAPKNLEPSQASLDEDREHLQNKLKDLQSKRSGLDKLLQELQMIHSQPLENLRNNDPGAAQNVGLGPSNIPPASQHQRSVSSLPPPPPPPPQAASQRRTALPPPPPPPPTSTNVPSSLTTVPEDADNSGHLPSRLQARMNDMAAPTSSAVDSALATFAQLAAQGTDMQQDGASMDPAMVAQVQEKLRRLKEVRGQLDQLRDLVEYYQNQRDDLDDPMDIPDGAEANTSLKQELLSGLDTQVGQSNTAVRNVTRPAPAQPPPQQENLRQLKDFIQPQQEMQQQHGRRGGEEAGAVGGASSLQNMVHLLNLAGTDEVDEHSDEDNASVSQSESQWSHLGPWDDDPEIQEKVKKLKAAKEKLRQLQDLVAFVQQAPDASRGLPDNLAEVANSTTEDGEGEAVSQATQTDEPTASVISETDSNQRNQQRTSIDETEGTRAELERLRKERAMLLDIQNQLKQIQDHTEGVNRTSEERGEERRERRDDSNGGVMGKSGQTAPSAPVVTFASNDELYSKMRRQRILREELRSKKKELEAIMKKDRNKRQYSRNQDNQSDTVSLNTDTFGIPASVDATMATWGGSTVDNLENITEDEDGQERNDREDRDDEDDDGYPSDGIVQVEEEEEENDSDNGTYTIEADARQRQNMRKGPMGNTSGMGARPKTSRGRQTYPQPSYNEKNTKKTSRRQAAGRSKRLSKDYKPRQENYRSAEDLIEEDETSKVEGNEWFQQMQDRFASNNSEWFQQIQDRLTTLTSNVESLMRRSDTDRQLSVSLSQDGAPQSNNHVSPMQEQMLQLQNQSMMLSFGQLVQSVARQQGDMNQLQQQLQNLQLQVADVHEQSFHGGVASGLVRPGLTRTPLNNSNANLHASLNHLMPNPFPHSALNNTAPANLFGGLSPGFNTLQNHPSGLGFSTGNLSTAGADGGRGAGLSVNTHGSPAVNATPNVPVSGFVFNPLSQSTLSSHQNHRNNNQYQQNYRQNSNTNNGGVTHGEGNLFSRNQIPQLSSLNNGFTGMATPAGLNVTSESTMLSRDFSQYVNTLNTDPCPSLETRSPGQFSFTNFLNRQTNQQRITRESNARNLFSPSFLSSTHAVGLSEDGDNDENPMPGWRSSQHDGGKRNKKRKHGSKVKKSQSGPLPGTWSSTARSDKLEYEEDVLNGASARPLWSSVSRGEAYRTTDPDSRGMTGDVAGEDFDANSSFSSIQSSIRDQHKKIKAEQTNIKSAEGGDESNCLFDTLRDTIYTEVASLISQNESRPHFLLDLFRDIRRVDSDFMRQRTLYAMEELLNARIKDENENKGPHATWIKSTEAETANSEQTPSESMTSEDDEDLKVTRLQEEITAAERSRINRLTRAEGSLRGYPYDYVETAENPSSLSTPTNGAEEPPFFQDALGETVIGFESLRLKDSARSNSLLKEKPNKQGSSSRKDNSRAQKKKLGQGGFLSSEFFQRAVGSNRPQRYRPGDSLLSGTSFGASSGLGATAPLVSQQSQTSDVAVGSVVDQVSESSMSDTAYPRIDMKQLDRQIKAIMLETIPVVKEHMDDVCSSQLLAYIKRLVLSLTGQVGSQEFARFFHRQLASILEDTLQKYHGRKMRECGEDMLVEISDVLFNELAFFRLMQDLDDPSVSARGTYADWGYQGEANKGDVSSDYSVDSTYLAGNRQDEDDGDDDDDGDDSVLPKGSMLLTGLQKLSSHRVQKERRGTSQRNFQITEADQDELGKERDDELANEVGVDDGEKDDDEAEHSYKIELAPSETKPFTRIGSDEDDDEGDEEHSMDDPSETAVSRDSMLETNNITNGISGDRQQSHPTTLSSTVDQTSGGVDERSVTSDIGSSSHTLPRPETEGGAHHDGTEKQDREKPIVGAHKSPSSKVNGNTVVTRPSAVENGVAGNHNDDDGELTVDDLPDRLTVEPVGSAAASNTNRNNSS